MGSMSYLSVSDLRLMFGLGEKQKIDELTVFWPGGQPQVIKDLAAGGFYRLVQGREPVPFKPGEKRIEPGG
jgi:hypothetical protein